MISVFCPGNKLTKFGRRDGMNRRENGEVFLGRDTCYEGLE